MLQIFVLKVTVLTVFITVTLKKSYWEKYVMFLLCLYKIQFANPDFMESISEVIDEVIQNCPIDVRRPLYKVSAAWGRCSGFIPQPKAQHS